MNPSIIGIWGAPGTIKSTLAATWPMGISWHEFDIGGFERGSQYLNEEQKAGISLYQYPAPIKFDMGKRGHLLDGWMELWKDFMTNVKADLANPAVNTLVYDTGTLAWQACHRAYLQMLQQKNETREGLLQIEYGEINPWMQAMIQAPKMKGKHLVVTFHDAPYYVPDGKGKGDTMEEPHGYVHHQGWSHFPKIADLMLHTTIKDATPYAAIEDHWHLGKDDVKTGSAPLELARMKVPNPTYQNIDQLLTCAKAIRARGLPMTGLTPESIIEQGTALGAR